MAKTSTIGKKGEEYVRGILKSMGCLVTRNGNTSAWDLMFVTPDNIPSTVEIKTQPRFKKYNGFSIELAHKKTSYISSYWLRDDDFKWDDNTVCVPTGFSVSQAEYQAFTNGTNMLYWVDSKTLSSWVKHIFDNERHRITWGGKIGHTLQVQIKIDELAKLSKILDEKKKRGRKPSS